MDNLGDNVYMVSYASFNNYQFKFKGLTGVRKRKEIKK